jgi:hypothetical protein
MSQGFAGKVPAQITDGTLTATVRDTGSNDSLNVAITDASGNQITSFGGGTQYTEGDTDASITGTAMLWEDTSDTLRAVSAAKPLPVDLQDSTVAVTQSGTWNVTNVSGTVSLPTGASTLAEQQTQTTALQLLDDTVATDGSAAGTKLLQVGGTDGTNAQILSTNVSGHVNIADGGNTITVDGTVAATQSGTWNVTNVSGTVSLPTGASTLAEQQTQTTALQLIDDTVTTLGTDTYTEAASKAITLGAVRRDADTTLVNTTNEFAPLQVDANGRLKVEIFDGGDSHTVDGTVAATQSGTWNVTNVSGTVSLPTGASTLAEQQSQTTHLATIAGDTTDIETAVELIDDAIVADDAAFTPGTTKVMMAGFEFDDSSPDSVNEGDAGAARMSANRNVYTQIRDAAGNERGANVNASNQLEVSVGNTVTVSATNLDVRDLTSVSDSVAAVQSGTWSVRLTDGTDTADVLDLASANPLAVAILDGSGAQITSFGGGTQYTEGDTDASITGTAMLWEDTSDTMRSVSAAKPLPVNVVAGGAGDGAILDGVSSSIKATVLDYTNANPIAVRLSDTNGDYVGAGAGTQYTEDIASASDPVGTQLIARRRDSLSTETTTDGDNTAVNSTGKGELYVKHVDTIPVTQSGTWNVTNVSGTVSLPTGASTLAEQQTQTTALQLLDDTVATDGSAAGTKLLQVGGTDGSNAQILSTNASGHLNIADGGNTITVDGTVAATQSGTWNVTVNQAIAAGDNAIGRVKLTDGTDVADVLDLTNANPLTVAVVDGSGDQITSFGGGTQYTEGDTDASITGTAMLWEDGSDTLRAVSAAKPLPVDLQDSTVAVTQSGTWNVTNVSGTVSLPTGASTLAEQQTQTTALQLIDDTVTTLGTDTYTEATSKGLTIGAVRRDADTTLVGTTNEFGPLQMDANGRLKVEVFDSGDSHTVDNGGTFAVQVDGAALTSLQLIDDTVTTLGTDTYTEATSKGLTIGAVRRDADTPLANTTNEFSPLITDANGYLKVEVFDGGGTHTVDAPVATPVNVQVGNGTLTTGVVDETGSSAVDALAVGGGTPHDSVDSGNPVKVGFKAASALPTAVAASDRANGIADLWGRQLVSHIDPGMQTHINKNYTSTQTGTDVWDPTAGKKIAVTSVVIGTYGTTSGRIILWFGDNADTTFTQDTDQVLLAASFAPSSTQKPGLVFTPNTPVFCTTADRELHVTTDAGISFDLTIEGYEWA